MKKRGKTPTQAMTVLAKLRKSLGFTAEEVAAAACWSREQLRRIEQTGEPDEVEAEVLTDLYGVDVVEAIEKSGSRGPRHPWATLLKAKADVLDADSRFALAEVVTIAKEIRELERLLEHPDRWGRLISFRNDLDYSHSALGAPGRLASEVRRRLELPSGPIASVQRRILDPLGILLITVRIDRVVDAVSLATARTGGVIVLNEAAPGALNAFLRRVSLAHELCHLLYDRKRMRSVADFSHNRFAPRAPGDDDDMERRARAFAVTLLAPIEELVRAWKDTSGHPQERRVRLMMECFGIGYEATRAQLDNANLLPLSADMVHVPTDCPPAWEERDPSPALGGEGLEAVRYPRRGVLLSLLCEAWEKGLIAESKVREGLRVDPVAWSRVRSRLLERMSSPPPEGWSTSSAVHG